MKKCRPTALMWVLGIIYITLSDIFVILRTYVLKSNYIPCFVFMSNKISLSLSLSLSPPPPPPKLIIYKERVIGKSVPLQAWSGPECSRKLRFPDFMTTAQDVGKVVSLTHRPPLHPRKYSRYSFLLEAESTPGP